jgi:hypothetical protein
MSGASRRLLEGDILDALIDGDASPWFIHADLIRDFGHDDADIGEVIAILDEMVKRGWASPRHPSSPSKEFWHEAVAAYAEWLGNTGYSRRKSYFHDYGPSYALTNEGRRAWQRRTEMAS